jgi:hypothetical protein
MNQNKKTFSRRNLPKKIRHINSNKQIDRWSSSEKLDKNLRRSIPMFSKRNQNRIDEEEDINEYSDEMDFSNDK